MTEEKIYEEMLETFRQATGYTMTAEADLAVRLRAAAAQIMGLYRYADHTYRQAFPQTAEGENLDLHGALYGVTRLGAEAAVGFLQFSISQPLEEALLIPAGTVCISRSQVSYATVAEGVIPAGKTSAEVYGMALEPGSQGNTARGNIIRMQSPPDGIAGVVNSSDFLGGKDQEDDESYRSRIMDACRGLGNGANVAFYKNLVTQVGGVEYAAIFPCMNGAGTVGVVLAAMEGGVDAQVLADVEATLEAYKEAGVTVSVQAAEDMPVDIVATLYPGEHISTEEAKAKAETALTALFQGNTIGKKIYVAELVHCIMATGGVENVVITSPAADIVTPETARAVLGSVTLEEA